MKVFSPIKYGTMCAIKLFVQQHKEGNIDQRVIDELAEAFSSLLQEFDDTDFTERGADKKAKLLKKHILAEDGNRGRPTPIRPSIIQADLVEAVYKTGCIEDAKEIVRTKYPHYKKPVNDPINSSISFAMGMLYQKQTLDIAIKIPDEELKEVNRVYPEYLEIEIDGNYTFSYVLSEALRSHITGGQNTLLEHFQHYLSENKLR